MEIAQCSSRSRKKKKSAENRSLSASFSGGRETKRLRRCEKIWEDKHSMTDSNSDSETELKHSKPARKRIIITRAGRKAKLKQKILKKDCPEYGELVALVKQRDKCYKGPEESRASRTGARYLEKARIEVLYGTRRTLEDHCKFALHMLDCISLTKPEPVMDPEFMKEYKLQTEDCANKALEFYNEQNPGAEYELVEAIQSRACLQPLCHYGICYHVNFTAKPKNINGSGDGDLSPKLFFAELNHGTRDEDSPNPFICRCSIVDLDNERKVLSGCGHCHPSLKIYHPVGQFELGHFSYRPHYTLPMLKCKPNRKRKCKSVRLGLSANRSD